MRSRIALLVLLVLLVLLGLSWWNGGGPSGGAENSVPSAGVVEPAGDRAERKRQRNDLPSEPDDGATVEDEPTESSEDRISGRLESWLLPRGAEVDVPERRLRGRLVDTKGEPLEGWFVLLESTWLDQRTIVAIRTESDVPEFHARQATGPDGGFDLPYLEGGPRLLHVFRGGDQRARFPGLGDERFHELVVQRGSVRVGGRVLRDDGDRPIENAEVELRWTSVMWWEPPDGSRVENAMLKHTDAEGRWSMDGAVAGSIQLKVRADGLAPQLERDVFIPPAGTLELETRLHPGATLVGQVSDAVTGTPLAEARVFLEGDDGDWLVNTRTGADGTYRLGPVRAEMNSFFSASAWAKGYATTRIPVGVTQTGQREIAASFELPRAAIVRLRCTDRAGRPVERVLVAARSMVLRVAELPRDGGESLSIATVEPSDSADWTDSEGHVALEGLHPANAGEPLRVVFYRRGVAVHEVESGPLEAGEVRDLGTVVLAPAQAVRGTVVDESGTGLAGASVVVVRQGPDGADDLELAGAVMAGRGRHTRTDAAGTFEIRGCGAGTWDLYATANGLVGTVVRGIPVAPDNEPAARRVVLARGVTLAGRVLLPSGDPAPNASVMVLRNHPLPQFLMENVPVDAEGRFEIGAIPADAQEVEITATFSEGAGALWAQRVVDPADGPVELFLGPRE